MASKFQMSVYIVSLLQACRSLYPLVVLGGDIDNVCSCFGVQIGILDVISCQFAYHSVNTRLMNTPLMLLHANSKICIEVHLSETEAEEFRSKFPNDTYAVLEDITGPINPVEFIYYIEEENDRLETQRTEAIRSNPNFCILCFQRHQTNAEYHATICQMKQ